MLIIVIIWIFDIFCNNFMYIVFRPELSKAVARRAAQAQDNEPCQMMCWSENDTSEKNKAKTGDLSKSKECSKSMAGRGQALAHH